MKPIIYSQLVLISLVIIACDSKHQNESPAISKEDIATPKLYINTRTAIKIKGVDNAKDTVTVVNSDYVELDLSELVGGKFEAGKELEKPISLENFKLVFISITDKGGKVLKFANSTEFLNFMSEHGYDMADQKKLEYLTEYTFKKKK